MRRFTVTTQADNDYSADLPEPVRAEAAVWLARLHSDLRSADTERGFRAWFSANPLHAAAFERMTNTWEATRCLNSEARPRWRPEEPVYVRRSRRTLLAIAASVVAFTILGAWVLWPKTPLAAAQVFETDLGERRSLMLPDGSRLVLNTNSRVSIAFERNERRLILEKGQARFDVAKSPGRPFIVQAGSKQIVAVGTAFDVRWIESKLSVVLFEGEVTVSSSDAPPQSSVALVTLEAGELAQFDHSAVTIRSMPKLDREEAWLDGRAVFEGTRLSDAIAEMNRYTRRRLEYSDPIGEWRISGTFSVDDVDAFARSLVDLFPISIEITDERIVLRPTNDQ